MRKPLGNTKCWESSIVANARHKHEPKNTEGPEEDRPDGQENEAKEEDDSRKGNSLMR